MVTCPFLSPLHSPLLYAFGGTLVWWLALLGAQGTDRGVSEQAPTEAWLLSGGGCLCCLVCNMETVYLLEVQQC